MIDLHVGAGYGIVIETIAFSGRFCLSLLSADTYECATALR